MQNIVGWFLYKKWTDNTCIDRVSEDGMKTSSACKEERLRSKYINYYISQTMDAISNIYTIDKGEAYLIGVETQ